MPVRTNASGVLTSSSLPISDITNLSVELNSKVSTTQVNDQTVQGHINTAKTTFSGSNLVSKTHLDSQTSGKVDKAGDTLSGPMNTNQTAFTNQQLVTKKYVDDNAVTVTGSAGSYNFLNQGPNNVTQYRDVQIKDTGVGMTLIAGHGTNWGGGLARSATSIGGTSRDGHYVLKGIEASVPLEIPHNNLDKIALGFKQTQQSDDGKFLKYVHNGNPVWDTPSGASGSTSFSGLTDTPSSFTNAHFGLAVNSAANGVVFRNMRLLSEGTSGITGTTHELVGPSTSIETNYVRRLVAGSNITISQTGDSNQGLLISSTASGGSSGPTINDGIASTTTVWSSTEIANRLNGKATDVHSHVIGDVTGLQGALDGKMDDTQLKTSNSTSNTDVYGCSYINNTTNLLGSGSGGDLLGWTGSAWGSLSVGAAGTYLKSTGTGLTYTNFIDDTGNGVADKCYSSQKMYADLQGKAPLSHNHDSDYIKISTRKNAVSSTSTDIYDAGFLNTQLEARMSKTITDMGSSGTQLYQVTGNALGLKRLAGGTNVTLSETTSGIVTITASGGSGGGTTIASGNTSSTPHVVWSAAGGGAWVPGKVSLDDIVPTANIANGKVLKYDSTTSSVTWQDDAQGTSVTLTSLLPSGGSNGEILKYDGTNMVWATDATGSGGTTIANGSTSLPHLVWSGSAWVPGKIDSDTLDWQVYANVSDLPTASSHHGMPAHVHATGAYYFAHNGAWIELANAPNVATNTSNITTNTNNITTNTNNITTNTNNIAANTANIAANATALGTNTTNITTNATNITSLQTKTQHMTASSTQTTFNADTVVDGELTTKDIQVKSGTTIPFNVGKLGYSTTYGPALHITDCARVQMFNPTAVGQLVIDGTATIRNGVSNGMSSSGNQLWVSSNLDATLNPSIKYPGLNSSVYGALSSVVSGQTMRKDRTIFDTGGSSGEIDLASQETCYHSSTYTNTKFSATSGTAGTLATVLTVGKASASDSHVVVSGQLKSDSILYANGTLQSSAVTAPASSGQVLTATGAGTWGWAAAASSLPAQTGSALNTHVLRTNGTVATWQPFKALQETWTSNSNRNANGNLLTVYGDQAIFADSGYDAYLHMVSPKNSNNVGRIDCYAHNSASATTVFSAIETNVHSNTSTATYGSLTFSASQAGSNTEDLTAVLRVGKTSASDSAAQVTGELKVTGGLKFNDGTTMTTAPAGGPTPTQVDPQTLANDTARQGITFGERIFNWVFQDNLFDFIANSTNTADITKCFNGFRNHTSGATGDHGVPDKAKIGGHFDVTPINGTHYKFRGMVWYSNNYSGGTSSSNNLSLYSAGDVRFAAFGLKDGAWKWLGTCSWNNNSNAQSYNGSTPWTNTSETDPTNITANIYSAPWAPNPLSLINTNGSAYGNGFFWNFTHNVDFYQSYRIKMVYASSYTQVNYEYCVNIGGGGVLEIDFF